MLGGEKEVVAAFHTEFPKADHVSIGIDSEDLTDDARAAFEAAGLTVDLATVLTASRLTAPREVEAEVRTLVSDEDWEARPAQPAALPPDVGGGLHDLRPRQRAGEKLVDAGRGQRFGAFVEGCAASRRPAAS